MSYPAVPQRSLQLNLPPRLRDSTSSSVYSDSEYSAGGSKFPEPLDAVPITPAPAWEHSHFSPSTPRVEAGFKNERVRPPSLRERVGNALGRGPPTPAPPTHPARNHGWVLRALLVLVLLLLFANVILLDLRFFTVPLPNNVVATSNAVASAPSAASASLAPSTSASLAPSSTPTSRAQPSPSQAPPSPSASQVPPSPPASQAPPSPSASPTPASASAPAPANLASTLSPEVSSCLAQFPPGDPISWCDRCAHQLSSIPLSWFVTQAHDAENGQAKLNAVGIAAQSCSQGGGDGAPADVTHPNDIAESHALYPTTT